MSRTLSDEGIDNLKTLRANLRSALRNSESVTIGGGSFRDAELAILLYAVERTLAAEA